jgi:NAD(P)H-dependent FMN reductase
MTIVFLNGSLNPASTTRKLLEEVQTLLQKARYETDIINIGELDLPLFPRSARLEQQLIGCGNESVRQRDLWSVHLNTMAVTAGH